MELNLSGKTVAVTGGAGGIGAQVALEFAREGARVAVCDISAENLERLSERFKQQGFELFTGRVNVSIADELYGFAESVVSALGRLDVWVNNAGVNRTKPFLELTQQDWDFITGTNLNSVFWGTRAAAEQMMKTGGGAIINTASYSGLMPTSRAVPYSATKAAILSMTRSTAGSLAPYGIRVNAVVPATVNTAIIAKRLENPSDRESIVGRIALGRVAEPSELAKLYTFLASEVASYITGSAYEASGGKYCIQDVSAPWRLAEVEQ